MTGDELAPGLLFADRYRVEGIVAKGGMGAVYRAFDERIGEPVALKVLPPDGPEGEDSIARFHREVRLARRVTHKNVARVFDVGQSDGLSYLTMEMVEGESLRQVLQAKKRLPVREAIEAAISIAEGLAAAHEAGVVHRDLKPANVVVEKATGRLVVTDFGIARSLVDDDGLRTVGAIGTPAYMAPEQLLGEMVDGRSDVYALGVVLYEMITGARPFGTVHATAEARARLVGAPPDPRVHLAMPEPVARLVMKMLARGRDERPPSATDAARLLRALLELDLERPSHAPPLAKVQERVLAILPFRATGTEEEQDLASGVVEELADVLARTRGLRVLPPATMQRYAALESRAAGAAAGAESVVEGTIERRGSKVLVHAQMLEVAKPGADPVWTERFEGAIADVLTLQTCVAERIAEGLRIEMGTAVPAGEASREAVELYLRGRHALRRMRIVDPGGALALLDQCVAAAPHFRPGLAAHAVAAVRAWYLSLITPHRDWRAIAEASVQRALVEAGALPETHLAAGLFAAQEGRFRDVAMELGRAIEIAPTCVPAHEYLAGLELQAGRSARGLQRARYVVELDPELRAPLVDIARHHALFGRMDEYESALAEAETRGAAEFPGVWQLRMRVSAWRGDLPGMREAADRLALLYIPTTELAHAYADGAEGRVPVSVVAEAAHKALAKANPRWRSYGTQLLAEVYGLRGDADGVVEMVGRCTDGSFIDVEWLDHCPALGVARSKPGFIERRRQVMRVAEQIWSE